MKRIFVVGPPRSGSTLCQSLIMASEEVFSFPESHFFRKLPSGKGAVYRMRCLRSWWYLRKWAVKVGFKARPDFFMSREGGVDAFVAMADREARARGFSAWLEKTPSHLHVIKELHGRIPDIKTVFSVREAYGNIRSLKVVLPEWEKREDEGDLAYAISRWAGDMALARCRSRELGGFLCEYEAVTQNKREVINGLYDYLGLKGKERAVNADLSAYGRQVVMKFESWKKGNFERDVVKRSSQLPLTESEVEEIRDALEFLAPGNFGG